MKNKTKVNTIKHINKHQSSYELDIVCINIDFMPEVDAVKAINAAYDIAVRGNALVRFDLHGVEMNIIPSDYKSREDAVNVEIENFKDALIERQKKLKKNLAQNEKDLEELGQRLKK